ncbi:MAG: beta-lactamase protein [Paenibacillaceae bacterium]|jgi:L-ascorbate 6-phosphate lactonase|nr:beta-lactamase protein [Paenibacillaceae bacterium]
MLKVTWLGQAGLLLEDPNIRIIVDPYLSNSVEKVNPKNYRRKEVDASFLSIAPHVLLCTHNHLDHADPETLPHYLNNGNAMDVLAPRAVWEEVRKSGGSHNYVLFRRHTQWTCGHVRFTAVKAEHSDDEAIGVIIDDGDKTYYITGDTLYNSEIFEDLPGKIDVLFLPVNGAGNNMNMHDAGRFASRIKAKAVVPLHWGMFDEINPEEFICTNRVIPRIYEEIAL